jgi:hypothetical protein
MNPNPKSPNSDERFLQSTSHENELGDLPDAAGSLPPSKPAGGRIAPVRAGIPRRRFHPTEERAGGRAERRGKGDRKVGRCAVRVGPPPKGCRRAADPNGRRYAGVHHHPAAPHG